MPRRQLTSCHPVAEQIQSLILRGRAEEAKDLVSQALVADPGHPDLIAAQGLILAYSGEEEAAVKLLADAGNRSVSTRLQEILDHHFAARVKLAERNKKKDPTAEAFTKTRLADVDIRITACLIVKNEEKHLDRCLKSIRAIVD